MLTDRPPVDASSTSPAAELIDSTGLSVVVHAWREGQRTGTLIRLRSPWPRSSATILDMTGVTGLLADLPLPEQSAVTAPRRPAASA